MAFTSAVAGDVLGVRFYKGTGDVGQHTGSLWGPTGTRLATVTFTNETASGWQYAVFNTPVAIQPGTRYVVSYYAPVGRYSVTLNGLRDAQVSGPLTVSATGGRYVYSTGRPTSTTNHNYWVDVLFRPNN
jgi:hypothetical protein